MPKGRLLLLKMFLMTLPVILIIAAACQKADNSLPLLNVADSVTISEGSEGRAIAVIFFTLSFATEETLTMRWATRDGTAKAGKDYFAQADTTITFLPGETEKNAEVSIISDNDFEADEHFFVTINHVRNARLGNSQCRILVTNDDDYIPGLIFAESISTPEGNLQQQLLSLQVTLTAPSNNEVRFKFSTLNGTAKAGEDYVGIADSEIIFAPGETEKYIGTITLGDDHFEMDDVFYIQLKDLVNCKAENPIITIVIENDDNFTPQLADDGFITPMQYPGMELVWSDEFSGSEINLNYWTHEIGAGGWGNNELQYYTSSSRNSFVQDGKLYIVATRLPSVYHSARMITMNKKEFLYGRIDIRAKLPFGQGIWPAFWMLGTNFPEIGWPRCGEIDIMEYLGHDRTRVYGSVHYFQGGHRYKTGVYQLQGGHEFDDMFNVFSVVWQPNSIRWYVNYQQYFELTPSQIPFEAFRLPHFFIFNIAVGGNWPGNPNHTTVFPQTMMIDYIRVFQTPDG